MIAAVVIPAFDLRAALRLRPALETAPVALAPLPGSEPLLGSVTAAAEAKGVRPGMRLGEALATCPELVLVEQDPATAERRDMPAAAIATGAVDHVLPLEEIGPKLGELVAA